MDTSEILPHPPKGASRKDKFAYWAIRLTIVIVPALFAYLQARDEAASKAKTAAAVATRTAEVGYDELVMAVRMLETEVKDLRLYAGTLRGHIEILEASMLPVGLRMFKPETAPPPQPAPPLDLPGSLGEAVEQRGKP